MFCKASCTDHSQTQSRPKYRRSELALVVRSGPWVHRAMKSDHLPPDSPVRCGAVETIFDMVGGQTKKAKKKKKTNSNRAFKTRQEARSPPLYPAERVPNRSFRTDKFLESPWSLQDRFTFNSSIVVTCWWFEQISFLSYPPHLVLVAFCNCRNCRRFLLVLTAGVAQFSPKNVVVSAETGTATTSHTVPFREYPDSVSVFNVSNK